ncbi:MAG: nitrilase-related carbon-nitrogen hydrolase, partial [Candidatus Omnitrophota bacterium]|nr:nitrilase-related carbon-nitrogen hydrolase [Candidatus Omnitrophota bacterium]
MKKNLRLAIAQINCAVGDLEGNSEKITEYIEKAGDLGADIISFPELSVTGYPPEDLLLKPKFIKDNIEYLRKIAKGVGDILAVIGFVDKKGRDIYNSAAVVYKGRIRGACQKIFLPNYGVFDEKRYFTAGSNPFVFKLGEIIFGVNICEDIWHMDGPTKSQAALGAGFIININSSPYCAGKIKKREEVVRNEARANNVLISYTNLVGAQDELVFDGQSMVVNSYGKVISRASAFKEELLITDAEIPVARVKKAKKLLIEVSFSATLYLTERGRVNGIFDCS